MPFSPETIAMKPYNQCIKCEYLGVKCDGPNVIAMSKERFCEWCRERKEFLGWSNAKVSEVACVSKTTIERIMSGKVAGLNGETISAVTCALVYGYACAEETWGKYPCAMAAAQDDESMCLDCKRIKEVLAESQKKIDYLKMQAKQQDEMLKARHGYLKTKDFYIRLFLSALGISLIGNILMLIWIITKLL